MTGRAPVRPEDKVEGWRQAVVVVAAVVGLLGGPLVGLVGFIVLRATLPGGVAYTVLGGVVAIAVLLALLCLPLWAYRRLIGRNDGVHHRSGGATAAQ